MIGTRSSRRQFLGLLVDGTATALIPFVLRSSSVSRPRTVTAAQLIGPAREPLGPQKPADYTRLPRWRGFNLLEKFNVSDERYNRPFEEWDFDSMAEWGFNFVRLPLDYRIWTLEAGGLLEEPLREIDQAVSWGRARSIHVNLCLHRAPGYCVNPPKEALNLWGEGQTGKEALRQFAAQWGMLAARYRGILPSELSFNLINEPPDIITADQYIRVAGVGVEAIHREDPERLIIADGASWGERPVPELATLKIAQSAHEYAPMGLTQYRASWIPGADSWPTPTWPFLDGTNKESLWKETVEPWRRLADMGVGVHVGEWGAYNRTPHQVVLDWMRDCLENWNRAGFGCALWNLRGSFGILDSERTDVTYESYKGHKLDRKMLEVVRMS